MDTLDTFQKARLSQSSFKFALHKLKKLCSDLISDLSRTLYSPIERHANDPTLYLRYFVLMQHLGYTSIDSWVNKIHFDSLLQFLIGSSTIPNATSHYGFIKHLTYDNHHRSTLFLKDKNAFTKLKLKTPHLLQKLIPMIHNGIVIVILTHRFSSPEADKCLE